MEKKVSFLLILSLTCCTLSMAQADFAILKQIETSANVATPLCTIEKTHYLDEYLPRQIIKPDKMDRDKFLDIGNNFLAYQPNLLIIHLK